MLLFLALFVSVYGDVYMHRPRGSNDRNCERNVNRNNGNFLFDSQNNAKGGYACPRAVAGSGATTPPGGLTERMVYTEDSILELEWTAQHGCGTSLQQGVQSQNTQNVDCQIVLQMACESTLNPMIGQARQYTTTAGYQNKIPINRETIPRDGIPNNDNDAATTRIGTADPGQAIISNQNSQRFAVHESPQSYNACNRIQRNKGLFTADQNVNRRSAIGTRQNPNGGRRGLECPEERDYYPYWAPTPYLDLAYLVDDQARCGQSETSSAAYAALGSCGGWQSANIAEAGPTVVSNRNINGKDYKNPRTVWSCQQNRNTLAWDRTNEMVSGDWVGNTQGAAFTAAGLAAGTAAAVQSNNWKGLCVVTGANGGTPANVAQTPKNNNGLNNAAARLFNRREWPNNKAACEALGDPNVKWEKVAFTPGADISPTGEAYAAAKVAAMGPECKVIDESRSNHLGNSGVGDTATRYTLTVPPVVPNGKAQEACFIRIRYNMSSSDYARNLSSASNGNNSPIKQDPLVAIGSGNKDYVELAVNTNQYARTFQDRSYTFYIKKRDPNLPTNVLELNVGVRGKRGNIVQAYPAVEYDFVPNKVVATKNTKLIMQWTGTDYNPQRGCNDAEGGPKCNGDKNCAAALKRNPNTQGDGNNARSDRTSLLQTFDTQKNSPLKLAANAQYTSAPGSQTTIFDSAASARVFAFADAEAQLQALGTSCLTKDQINAINNENRRENNPRNCAKANAPKPYFAPQVIDLSKKKPNTRLTAFGARNNNFSNRDQKFTVLVADNPTIVSPQPQPPQIPTVSEMVVSAPQSATKPFVATTVAEEDKFLNADIPGFDPIENNAFGDGNQEGCTQTMLRFGAAPSQLSVFPLLMCTVFLLCRFN